MTTEGKLLWSAIEPLLVAFSDNLAAQHTDLITRLDAFSNEAIILSGNAELRKSLDRDAIVVNVFAQVKGEVLVLDPDCCMETGRVIVEGPIGSLSPNPSLSLEAAEFVQWKTDFAQFLSRLNISLRDEIDAL
ncbi:hypothetical protein [Iodidimonas sp. SYSU 1G8]|uniref:hypothetical protein n=1 Tax=Iodidimonas sp. SYSU 1G8 TaxID=3133967 RepID=UPI0031FEDB3C